MKENVILSEKDALCKLIVIGTTIRYKKTIISLVHRSGHFKLNAKLNILKEKIMIFLMRQRTYS